jgi:hypothetical protein
MFEFGDASLAVDCLWRIKVDARIALTYRDHRQYLGLPSPVDARADATSGLKDRSIIEVRLDERSADLTLRTGCELRCLTTRQDMSRGSYMLLAYIWFHAAAEGSPTFRRRSNPPLEPAQNIVMNEASLV